MNRRSIIEIAGDHGYQVGLTERRSLPHHQRASMALPVDDYFPNLLELLQLIHDDPSDAIPAIVLSVDAVLSPHFSHVSTQISNALISSILHEIDDDNSKLWSRHFRF
ncbi:hypothetical protein FEM48_Zijuj05G0019800 [Ziziphus jujuba var. spinosa]|uniref:Uncharacterized protein n=1 Tax=Ziziphus jujuba var. spinosa TaxID=714518 RepID=A0A978VC55_ZIZJJ|nr:hypothetical protein FEM48_Zijuj05G0019800 [Ziziphus jujuba var. spinosa]